jgi:hypothetical protein
MTFTDALIASGYYFQPHTGAFCKEDSNDNLHSYVEQEDGEWSYEKYDQDDQLVTTKVFSLN